ncbi:MAG: hydrogenase formation protein HypD [Bacteroidales bacterium]|nr:hydrogenase formation protein HypD [Bacteroidales bacterium]
MKFIDEYRNKNLILKLAAQIRKSVKRDYTFMEVCGGHTSAIHRFGIPSLLPECIRLISGPGCPVCVTGTGFIDKAIYYSAIPEVILTTFGDLMRVPGSATTLEKMKARGADIRIVLSSLESLAIAWDRPDKKVIFLSIGFETTAPGTAVTVKQAEKQRITNFFLLNAHKVMPPAMEAIMKDNVNIDGFICPGHVATITGPGAFSLIPEKYRTGCVITGFEPTDILMSILMLIRQVNQNSPAVEVQYSRAVTVNGNSAALKYVYEVFEPCDSVWRGLGTIPLSGLKLRSDFERYDAEKVMPVSLPEPEDNELCACGEVLRGVKTPSECPLFASVCIPGNPVGACMVSAEGACNTWYRYRMNNE